MQESSNKDTVPAGELDAQLIEEFIIDFIGIFSISRSDGDLLDLVQKYFIQERGDRYKNLLNFNQDVIERLSNKFRTPRTHEAITQQKANETMMETYIMLGQLVHEEQTVNSVEDLANTILQVDMRTLQKFTPETSRIRESFIWQYVVQAKQHSSPLFRQLALELKPVIEKLKTENDSQLLALIKIWEEKHPGQSFWGL